MSLFGGGSRRSRLAARTGTASHPFAGLSIQLATPVFSASDACTAVVFRRYGITWVCECYVRQAGAGMSGFEGGAFRNSGRKAKGEHFRGACHGRAEGAGNDPKRPAKWGFAAGAWGARPLAAPLQVSFYGSLRSGSSSPDRHAVRIDREAKRARCGNRSVFVRDVERFAADGDCRVAIAVAQRAAIDRAGAGAFRRHA